MSIVKEIERTDDFDKLEQVGLRLNKKLYNFRGKMIPTPKISLGEDQNVM